MTAVDSGAGGAAGSGLGEKVGAGLRWSFVNLAVNKGLSIASGIALARILVPEDFGTYAVAIAVVNILFGLNDLGLVVAIIRWQGDLRQAARTAMTLSTTFSALLYAACFAAAPVLAEATGSPEATGVLRLLAVTVLIDGLVSVPHGLLVRTFRQDRMAVVQFASTPTNFGIAILLAVLGAGPWSLAIGQVAGNVVAAVLHWVFSPLRVGFGFHLATARSLLSFGIPLALTSVVEYLLLNADYLIVGATIGAGAAGLYLLAYNVSNWIVVALTDAVRPVSLAGFAQLSAEGGALRSAFSRAYSLLITLAVPLVAVQVVLAPELIGFLYGDRWTQAAHVLQFLAVLSAVRVAVGFVFDLLIGAGRSRTTLWLQCAWLVALLPALVLGAQRGGIRGVGIAHAGVALVVALPLFLAAIARFGIDLPDLALRLVRPAAGGGAAAAVGVVLSGGLDGRFVTLALVGPAMLLTYAVIVVPPRWLNPAAWQAWWRSRAAVTTAGVAGAGAES